MFVFSDEVLTENLNSEFPGPRREAEALLPVPLEHRARVSDHARLATNMSGGRYSSHLFAAASRWESLIAKESIAADRVLAHGTYTETNLPVSRVI